MSKKLQKITKWSRFRHERTKTIDEYIRVRKKIYCVQQLITIVKLDQILDYLANNYKIAYRHYRIHLMRVFIVLKVSKHFKKRLKCYGNIERTHLNRLRFSFSFLTVVTHKYFQNISVVAVLHWLFNTSLKM